MKEKKNRLSKLSIVVFVIACFCIVSVTTQHSQAQTLAVSSNTSFVGIIWSYFFPTANSGTSGTTGENPEPTPDRDGEDPPPTPDITEPTPDTCIDFPGTVGCPQS
jgi:hypothetical protein